MFPKPLSVLLLVKENAQVLYPADWHSIGVVPPLPYAVPAVPTLQSCNESLSSVCCSRASLKVAMPAVPTLQSCNESLSSVCCARASLKVAMPAVVVIHAMKEHFNNNCDRRRVIK